MNMIFQNNQVTNTTISQSKRQYVAQRNWLHQLPHSFFYWRKNNKKITHEVVVQKVLSGSSDISETISLHGSGTDHCISANNPYKKRESLSVEIGQKGKKSVVYLLRIYINKNFVDQQCLGAFALQTLLSPCFCLLVLFPTRWSNSPFPDNNNNWNERSCMKTDSAGYFTLRTHVWVYTPTPTPIRHSKTNMQEKQ